MITDVVNNPKHYIPQLTTSQKVPFPFEIAPLQKGSGSALTDVWQMLGDHVGSMK